MLNMVIYGCLSLSSSLGGERFMEHWGTLEWVRCSSQARHIIAIFSHIQLHDTEPNRNVNLAWKVLPNYMGGTSRAGRGQVLLKLREVTQVWRWTRTQVALSTCLSRF